MKKNDVTSNKCGSCYGQKAWRRIALEDRWIKWIDVAKEPMAVVQVGRGDAYLEAHGRSGHERHFAGNETAEMRGIGRVEREVTKVGHSVRPLTRWRMLFIRPRPIDDVVFKLVDDGLELFPGAGRLVNGGLGLN